jgi:hypothetical protein
MLVFVGAYAGQVFCERSLNRAIARVERLRAVYAVLGQYEADHGRPPAVIADLEPYRTKFPVAVGSIERAEVVVVWGRALRARREFPVAVVHEPLDRKARVRVLWLDGSVFAEDAAVVASVGGEK